jgi:hypothetical protein
MVVEGRLFAWRERDAQHADVGVVEFHLVMGGIHLDGILGEKRRGNGDEQTERERDGLLHGGLLNADGAGERRIIAATHFALRTPDNRSISFLLIS